MKMQLSARLKLACIFFLLPTTHVFCESAKECARILRETFELNVDKLVIPGEIIVWNISSNSKPFEPISAEQFSGDLNTNQTYIFMAKKAKGYLQIYYWLGKGTSSKLKQTVAAYAIMFFYLSETYLDERGGNPANEFSREYEGIESPSFKETLHSLKNNTVPRTWPKNPPREMCNAMYRDTNFPSNFPNMYVVRGKQTTRVKKVAVNSDWLKVDDACLILETGYSKSLMEPLSILFGDESTIDAQTRALKFAEQFKFHRIVSSEPIPVIKKTKPSDAKYFDQFCRVLEEGNEHNPHEVDDPSDRTTTPDEFVHKRDASYTFLLLNIRNNMIPWLGKRIQREIYGSRPLHSGLFTEEYDGCYLLDTSSASGVYLILGENSEYQTNMKAIEEAEQYLEHKVPSPTQMRIVKQKLMDRYHDLNINLADWPKDPSREGKLW